MKRALAGLAAGVFCVGLAACSGGGGGGGGGGAAPLVYTGNTNPAVIGTSNAAVLTANASDTDSGADVAGAFTSSLAPSREPQTGQGPGAVPWRVAQRVAAAATKPTSNSALTSVAVNETDQCANGGSVSINGDLTPGGTGTVNVTFRNCVEGGDSLNGVATLTIASVLIRPAPQESLLLNFTVSFGRLSLRGSANADLGGFVQVQIDPAFQTEKVTENTVVLDFDTGQMTKSEFTFQLIFNNSTFPASYTKTINGRVFHSVHGFVSIATNPSVPLAFASLTQPFPQSGELTLTGANGVSILVQAISANAVKLSLDLDPAVAGFERVVTLAWTDLTGPAGSDLRDSDHDGMHDSWELAYGLDPAVNDALGDKDSDNAANIIEYLNGTKPNDPGSRPPGTDISATSIVSANPVASGASLTYTININNLSAVPANDVILSDVLPAGVNFVSAIPSQGTCSGAPVMCNLNTIGAFSGASVAIQVTVAAASGASLLNIAAVGTSSFDTAVTNNNSSTVVTVN